MLNIRYVLCQFSMEGANPSSQDQMSVIDEKHKIIARIRMLIDAQQVSIIADDDMEDSSQPANEFQAWHFGSPDGKKVNLCAFLRDCAKDMHFSNLDEWLRMFIAANIPKEALQYEEDIYVSGRPAPIPGSLADAHFNTPDSTVQMSHPLISVLGGLEDGNRHHAVQLRFPWLKPA